MNALDRDGWIEALNQAKSELKLNGYRKINLLTAAQIADNITKLSDRSCIGLVSDNSNIGIQNSTKKLIVGPELNNGKKMWKEQKFSKELLKVSLLRPIYLVIFNFIFFSIITK